MNSIRNFDFILPTRIRFGCGVSQEIGKEIKIMEKGKIFIITDKGLMKAGIINNISEKLIQNGLNDIYIFDQVEANPRDTTVHNAYEAAKKFEADILVSVGGGSSMDTAKAVGVLLNHGGVIQDYEGIGKINKKGIPLIAIPTTVGTGSEVTFWSVITDSKRHFKMSVGSPMIAPDLALVDPDLVETLPPSIVASTGMDALTHAIEGYTCNISEPITDACGLYAIELISKNIRNAVYSESKESKANMLLGSLIAGISFGNADIAGVHCMAEALGGLYDTPHGVANAILLPYVMEYNFVADIRKFSRIAIAMGENVHSLSERDAAYQSVLAVKKLNQDLNIPTLAEVGTQEKDLEELAERSSMNVSVESNPRKINKKDFLKIFEKAFYI